MPKLDKGDWVKLRDTYGVAFKKMPSHLFELLLNKVYANNPGSGSANPDEDEKINALMVYLARGEPPIIP